MIRVETKKGREVSGLYFVPLQTRTVSYSFGKVKEDEGGSRVLFRDSRRLDHLESPSRDSPVPEVSEFQ